MNAKVRWHYISVWSIVLSLIRNSSFKLASLLYSLFCDYALALNPEDSYSHDVAARDSYMKHY